MGLGTAVFLVTEPGLERCFLFKHCRTLVAAAYTGDTFAKYYQATQPTSF